MYAASSLSHVRSEVLIAVNNVAVVCWFTTMCAVTDGQQPLRREKKPACCNLQKFQISALESNCTMILHRVTTATTQHGIIIKKTKV